LAGSFYLEARFSGAKTSYDVPFVGLYAAVIGHGFFADLQIRGDFYSSKVTDASLGLTNASHGAFGLSVAASAGYQITFGSVFVEPSASLVWSHINIDTLGVPGGGLLAVPSGAFHFDDMNSLLGRVGARVGVNWQSGQVLLQPFVSANVLHEFAGKVDSTFVGGGFIIPTTANDVGTFGQFGVGLAVLVPSSAVAGYVRLDYRKGENIDGLSVNGGLRWNF
jgi:outer membrane autotransporter protein